MSFKSEMLALLSNLPDDEEEKETTEEVTEKEVEPETQEEQLEKPKDESETASGEPEKSDSENEIVAPDKVVVTSEDMVENTVEMQLATVKHDFEELKTACALLRAEVEEIKGCFVNLESTVDIVETPPLQSKSYEEIINNLV